MHEAPRKRMVSRSPSSYNSRFLRSLARATEEKLESLGKEKELPKYNPGKRLGGRRKKEGNELEERPLKKMRIDLPPSRAMKILENCKEKKSTPPKSAGDLFRQFDSRDKLWSNTMDVSPSSTRATPRMQNAFDSYRQNARPSFDLASVQHSSPMQHSTPVSSRPPSRSSSEKSRHDKPYARVSPKSPCKKSLDYGKYRPNSRLVGDIYNELNKENCKIEPDLEGKLMGYGATLTKIVPKPIEEVDLEQDQEELVSMLRNNEDWGKTDAYYSIDDGETVDAFVPDEEDDATPTMFRQSNFYELAQQYDAKVEPHLMGFPNSLNDCWLNSSVQCLLSLEPFVHELESFVLHFKERTNLSQVVRSFVVLNRHRREGSRLKVNEAIRKFQKSLHAIRKEFSGSNQQDVSEFLVCFFDFLCDESKRLCAGSLTDSTLRELSLNNDRGEPEKCDEVGAGPSPVGANFTLTIVRNKACSGCSYVGVEREKVQTIEVSPNNATSLQAALNQSLKSETVERACECGAREGVTSSQIEVLPRFLVLHVNRYLVSNSDKGSPVTRKLTNPLRIPKYLSTDVVTTDEPRVPAVWTPDMTNGEDAVNDQYDSLLSVDTPTKNSKLADDIDEDEEVLQQVLLASRRDAELAALDDSSHDTPTVGGQEAVQECDGTSANCYQLTSVISHIGSSSNQGHYVADVYNYTKQGWFRYDDMQVAPQDYSEVVNKQQQKNGYIFVYVHKAQLAQLVHNDQTPKKNNPFVMARRKLAQVDVD